MTIINYATYCAKVLNQNDELVYEEDLHGMWPINRYVNLLMGEIPRLSDDANGYGRMERIILRMWIFPKM